MICQVYSSLLICNRAVTNRHVRGNSPVLVHLDRVFTKVPIAVFIWTVFLQKYPSWLYFLAVLGLCFFTSFHGGFTNKIVFLQQCHGYKYRQWTHIRTYGTDVFAMDMLSSISQASGDKLMKPRAYYCVLILVLRRLLPDF